VLVGSELAVRVPVIELSLQMSFADGLIREEVGPLWDKWLRHVDTVLADANAAFYSHWLTSTISCSVLPQLRMLPDCLT
jgi:hypothetical protein